MPDQIDRSDPIEDTRIFDHVQSRKGYRLNKLAMSMTKATNREAFKANEELYMARFNLTEMEKQLIRDRDWRAIMSDHGGNIYMIMKIGAVLDGSLYRIGAHQRSETYRRQFPRHR